MKIETVENGYRVDGEIGRFQFATHNVYDEKRRIIFNTSTDMFPGLKPKERYLTSGFKEIAMLQGDIDKSFRKTSKLINRVRYQQAGGTPYRTLHANTEREGLALIDYFEKKSNIVLKEHLFSEDGSYKGKLEDFSSIKPILLPEKEVKTAAESLDCDYSVMEILKNPVYLEDPSRSVNVSIDDVCVKRQREAREKDSNSTPGKSKRKYVHDTVIRVDKDRKCYSLVGEGIKTTIRYLIAFLLSNDMTGHRFQFFTDGHTTIMMRVDPSI
jgi:hypothetical protein